jgi:cleavage stimulation factor subunit 3
VQAAAQISYIEHYLNQPPPSAEAEELFKRWVKSAPSVELFRFYLTYIRYASPNFFPFIVQLQYNSRIHADPTRRDPTKREIIRKAYEFALNPPHGIGQDKDSGDIWLDYIQFLSEAETTTTWDSQQNMDALRKVYHRAVQIPLDNVERIWSDLEAFETKLNRITAKKFMADLTPAHMQARTTYRQLMIHVNGLYPPAVGTPELYLPTPPTFTLEDRTLVGKWKAYLKWEEGNPLEIEEKDRAFLVLRLQTVYRKAVVRMRYYSEIWLVCVRVH